MTQYPTAEMIDAVQELILRWDSRREGLNMRPDDKRRFIEREAAILAIRAALATQPASDTGGMPTNEELADGELQAEQQRIDEIVNGKGGSR